jgi:hypothetical protein
LYRRGGLKSKRGKQREEGMETFVACFVVWVRRNKEMQAMLARWTERGRVRRKRCQGEEARVARGYQRTEDWRIRVYVSVASLAHFFLQRLDVAFYARDGGLECLSFSETVSLLLLLLTCSSVYGRGGCGRIATHVNVFGEQFVGNTVFVNDIIVQSSTAQHSSGEESKNTV